MNVQKNIVQINGQTYVLKRWHYEYRKGGRRRHWLRFIAGWCRGVFIKVCLGVAASVDVIANVAREKIDAIRDIDESVFRQRVLMDAAIGAC